MRKFLFLFLALTAQQLWSQREEAYVPFYTNAGLVSYYFWEEQADGSIIESTFKAAFTCNSLVTVKDSLGAKGITQENLRQSIERLARPFHTNQKVSTISKKIGGKHVAFTVIGSQVPACVLFIKKNGRWTSRISGRMLYFNRLINGALTFDHDEMDTLRVQLQAKTAPEVKTCPYNSFQIIHHFLSKNDLENHRIAYDQVKGFFGHDLTKTLEQQPVRARRYLLFVNGYRGPMFDNDPSKNEIYMNDRTNYWFNLDYRFIQRLRPDTTFYLDGSFTVKTSNHHTKLGFGMSYLKCGFFASPKHFTQKYSWLNTEPNVCGFDWRKRNGYIAGIAMLNTLHNQPNSIEKDTLDIVCHSMGYAYTLGFLEAVANDVVLGKLYILAPENANAGTFDWSKLQEVFQYGANLGQPNQDILSEQDGVAPQIGVPGLPIGRSPYGRFFSPKGWPNKNFIHSHMVYSYDWIFDRIYPNEPGYIH